MVWRLQFEAKQFGSVIVYLNTVFLLPIVRCIAMCNFIVDIYHYCLSYLYCQARGKYMNYKHVRDAGLSEMLHDEVNQSCKHIHFFPIPVSA